MFCLDSKYGLSYKRGMKTLSVLTYVLASAAVAIASDGGQKNLRADVAAASAAFNAAMDSLSAYKNLLADMNSRAASIASESADLHGRAVSSNNSLVELRNRIDAFKNRFDEACSGVGEASENLAATVGAFPVAEKLNATAKTLIDELQQIVLKNPGNDYQDKKYFDGVKASYYSARSALESAQSRAIDANAAIAVSKPKIDGIKSTLEMCGDYYEKAAGISGENVKNSERVLEEALKISKQSESESEAFGGLANLSANTRAVVLASFFAYGKWLADSPIESGASVKDDLNLRGVPLGESALSKKQKAFSASLNAAQRPDVFGARAIVMDNKLEGASRASLARPTATSIQPKNVREDILNSCARLICITNRICALADVINQQTYMAKNACYNLDDCSSEVSSMLSDVIGKLSNSQILSSEILRADVNEKTQISQNEISAQKMKDLNAKAKDGFEKAAEIARNITSSIK